ncbi:unnamed protein product [Blepharisma stoltei]|uniref:START domain-containing protein n=1 Tax=Blepharisma stoltei TaxID=1481888 RepID=A0AAU9IZ65_9CILI|nr:unnamed protein product [Blepharisma stoltei]
MGCCASRDKSASGSKENSAYHPKINSIISEAQRLCIRPIEENLDIQPYDLLKYIEELNTEASWNTIKEDLWFYVKSIRGSKFDKTSPVSKVWLHLDEKVPLKKVLDVILLAEKRKNWDDVATVEIFDGTFPGLFYVYQSVMLLGYKNDYVTKTYIKTSGENVAVISCNVEHEKKPIEKGFNRGVIHFNIILISLVNNHTEILIYNQTDPKNKLGKLSADKKIENLDKLCSKLKDEILKDIVKTPSESSADTIDEEKNIDPIKKHNIIEN